MLLTGPVIAPIKGLRILQNENPSREVINKESYMIIIKIILPGSGWMCMAKNICWEWE